MGREKTLQLIEVLKSNNGKGQRISVGSAGKERHKQSEEAADNVRILARIRAEESILFMPSASTVQSCGTLAKSIGREWVHA